MLRSGVRASAIACIVLLALAGAAAAIASDPPRILSPADGATVKARHVVLVVHDPGLRGTAAPVYLVVAHTRRVDRHGHLTFRAATCGARCDEEAMSRWPGHPGEWIFQAVYKFRGYWAVTPGTYYWQVYHYVPRCSPMCVQYSRIRSLRVVR